MENQSKNTLGLMLSLLLLTACSGKLSPIVPSTSSSAPVQAARFEGANGPCSPATVPNAYWLVIADGPTAYHTTARSAEAVGCTPVVTESVTLGSREFLVPGEWMFLLPAPTCGRVLYELWENDRRVAWQMLYAEFACEVS